MSRPIRKESESPLRSSDEFKLSKSNFRTKNWPANSLDYKGLYLFNYPDAVERCFGEGRARKLI